MIEYLRIAVKRFSKAIIVALAALAALAMAPTGPAKAQNSAESRADPIAEVADSDPEMNAAIAEAQETLPQFFAALDDRSGRLSNITFKFPLDGYEHIWVGNVSRKGGMLTGTLSNNPHAAGWKMGDTVSVPAREVSDWGYRTADGVMQGMFTTRVLLDRIDPAQAVGVRAHYGWE